MRKLFFLLFLLLSNSFLISMEQEVKRIAIEDAQGTVFRISEEESALFGVIKKWNEESDDIYDEDERQFSLHGAAFFTQENLQLLFSIAKHKSIEKCQGENIKDIFKLADALEAPKKVLKKLSKKAWDSFSLEEINEEMPGMYTYLKSIASVPNEQASENELYFIDQGLCHLTGIQAIANGSLRLINLNNNQLRFVNIKNILRLAPNLEKLDLGHNRLEQIELPYHLPDFFILNLSNNMLVTIPAFKVGEGCVVDLGNNPLSMKARTLALSATKWNYMKYIKVPYRRIFCSFPLKNYLRSLFCTEGTLGGAVALIARIRSSSTYIDEGHYEPTTRLNMQYTPPQDWSDYFDTRRSWIDSFTVTQEPGWKWVNKWIEIPSGTTFANEAKKLLFSKYFVYGICAGLTGAWLIADYYSSNPKKKYKESKIKV